MSARVYEFGPFRLDADKAVLWRDDEVASLTPKALVLLHALVEAGGDVVPKADLMSRAWPDTAVQEANLGVTVAALRRVLGPWVVFLDSDDAFADLRGEARFDRLVGSVRGRR